MTEKIVRVKIINNKIKWGLLTIVRFYFFNFPSMGFFIKTDGGVYDLKINI